MLQGRISQAGPLAMSFVTIVEIESDSFLDIMKKAVLNEVAEETFHFNLF